MRHFSRPLAAVVAHPAIAPLLWTSAPSSCVHVRASLSLQPCRPLTTSASNASGYDDLPTLHYEDIARLAKLPQHQLRLADLVRYGWPPLSEEALLQSANFALERLPVRLARRLLALRNLPYIVVSNSHVRQIYGNYHNSLRSLLPWTEHGRQQGTAAHATSCSTGRITTLDDEIAFTDVLAELVATHQNTIPILAQGFLECRKYIAPATVTAFLDEHLRARIGTRLMAEQHIAMHTSSQPSPHGDAPGPASSYIGIIDTQLCPARTIDSCAEFVADICELKYGVRPLWVIDGGGGSHSHDHGLGHHSRNGPSRCTFAYVPMHLEYIVTELLKNAFRAVVENGMHREPVVITIAPEPTHVGEVNVAVPPSASASVSANPDAILPPITPLDDSAPGVTIRIRDRGGGISPDVLPSIWSYSFTTFDEHRPHHSHRGGSGSPDQSNSGATTAMGTSSGSLADNDALNILTASNTGGSSIAGLGYGLPLSRAYAEFFGGGIAVQSLYGWGTDVYLRLKGVGNIRYKER